MDNTIKLLVNKVSSDQRLDLFLAQKINYLTRTYLKKLISKKLVKINNVLVTAPSKKIKTNDKIIIIIKKIDEKKLIPAKIELDIVYEDNDLLVVNKPKGMVVHPGAGNNNNTLANALAYKYKKKLSNINGLLRPGIVHRIDKETSGLLVIAKNNSAHAFLGNQFSKHTIKRKYKCLIWGVIRPLNGQIETLISRDKKNRQLMTVSDVNGKKAITKYKTLKVFYGKNIPKISLIECELKTGRTHQIRVHFKYKGSSLLGDYQYGKKNNNFKKVDKDFIQKLENIRGQALHAETLEFEHPTKKKWVAFKSDVPDNFKKMLDLLNKLSS